MEKSFIKDSIKTEKKTEKVYIMHPMDLLFVEHPLTVNYMEELKYLRRIKSCAEFLLTKME